jgi:hypothetical protein
MKFKIINTENNAEIVLSDNELDLIYEAVSEFQDNEDAILDYSVTESGIVENTEYNQSDICSDILNKFYQVSK